MQIRRSLGRVKSVATNRLGFKQFLKKVKDQESVNVVIDSNILIAFFDEVHSNNELVRSFLSELDTTTDVTFFTTVTTKSEFLDYARRRHLTEGLYELIEDNQKKKNQLIPSAFQAINKCKMRARKRQSDEEKKVKEDIDHFDSRVCYFYDSDLKEIKKSFRARDVQKELGWLSVCEKFLAEKLAQEEYLLDEMCEYLSPHREEQKELFNNTKIDWKKATHLSSKTGMGYSDALILNMFSETRMDYLLTLDYDLIYAVSISAKDKYVVLPDNRIKQFKAILKKV